MMCPGAALECAAIKTITRTQTSVPVNVAISVTNKKDTILLNCV